MNMVSRGWAIILAGVFIMHTHAAYAAGDLPRPGFTPESALYTFELLFDDIGTFFTFGHSNKTARYIYLSRKRISEASELSGNNDEGVSIALDHYSFMLKRAATEAILADTKDPLASVAETVIGDMVLLDDMSEDMPSEKRGVVRTIKEYVIDDATDAIQQLFSVDGNAAWMFFGRGLEDRMTRAVYVKKDEEFIGEALREYEKWALFGASLLEPSKKDIVVQEQTLSSLLRTSFAAHESLLGEIRAIIRPQAEEQMLHTVNAIRKMRGQDPLLKLDDAPFIEAPGARGGSSLDEPTRPATFPAETIYVDPALNTVSDDTPPNGAGAINDTIPPPPSPSNAP